MIRPNPLMESLELTLPILQAPMAGADTAEMAIAAGQAGALGSLGCAYRTPEQIRAATAAVRAACGRRFGINLFAPTPDPGPPNDTGAAMAFVAPYYRELGIALPKAPTAGGFDFAGQIEAALDSGASLFSFTFGLMPGEIIEAARNRGMLVAGTATTVREAIELQRSGVDAIVAQGAEAGGHRGTFLADPGEAMIGTLALVPQTVDAVDLPVIASGGIACGRGIAAVLALGASAAQIGTAFLTCAESGAAPAYQDAILKADSAQTRTTTAFSGRLARGIANRVINDALQARPDAILPFPYQNALTRPLRAAAAVQGRADFLSLWAGQGIGQARSMTTAALIAALTAETAAAIGRLTASMHAPEGLPAQRS